ncbi:MAG: hypothetical protein A2174_03015 [Candidatus Portnoybacteria bacterium RBG_13_41_18]|uniref:Uncharacterized protein n=1 Tax=Candidatus Portnoybacteria bacterium RBG_13_41_18 TaxID=1801991 RepID=A0A1G2F944_9BACT|nr:MAG: hypothetical protein A2174_03015 [Candidatus Portnoybacteria bacterium RBG_13_41_18]
MEASQRILLKALEKKLNRAMFKRAINLVCLFQLDLPEPLGPWTARIRAEGNGWNRCVVSAIKTGTVPNKRKWGPRTASMRAFKRGWNEARMELAQGRYL